MNEVQPDLFAAQTKLKVRDHDFLVTILKGKDWMTCVQILQVMGLPPTESNRRSVRDIVSNAEDEIAGGQEGYKLIDEMTRDEYLHWRNWMRSQARVMLRRVIKSDKRFYSRAPVETGV